MILKRFENNLSIGTLSVRDVYRLQNYLELNGYGDFIPSGIYGPKTRESVIKLQTNLSLPATGFFGSMTREKVNANISKYNREQILKTAVDCLGMDASPDDIAPDEYGCAETVTTILRKAGVDIPIMVSTYELYKYLLNSNDFSIIAQPDGGDIIVSPTGRGNGNMKNGHTGIMYDTFYIMSSNSLKKGIFEKNYSIPTWVSKYKESGGFPVLFFRIK